MFSQAFLVRGVFRSALPRRGHGPQTATLLAWRLRMVRREDEVMMLLVAYIGLAILGNAVAYLIGLLIEQFFPPASLPAFLAMFFLVLWFAWLGAVRLTAPKVAATI